MTAALGYIRVSTEEQARAGYSLAAQESAIRAYCTARGWTLGTVYRDEGLSGTLADRPGLLALLEAAAGADVVVVWKLDRLARRVRLLLHAADRLEAVGAALASITEQLDTSTPVGRAVQTILGAMGELERDQIAERIQAGQRQKARQGLLTGPLPLGYERVGGLVRPDDAAPFVRALFERYATGDLSLRETAAWTTRRGHALDRLAVRKVLINRTYTGVVVWHARAADAQVFEGLHEPLVPLDLFDQVQARLRERRRQPPRRAWGRTPYTLSGIARCGWCGTPMSGSTSGPAKVRYLRCRSTALRSRLGCPQPMVRAEAIEEQVGRYLADFRVDEATAAAVLAEVEASCAVPSSDQEMTRRLRAYEQLRTLGEISEAELDGHRRRLAARYAAPMGRAVMDLGRAQALLREVGRLWKETGRPEQRAVRNQTVEAIEPRAAYRGWFVADRRARFGGNLCVEWLPGQDSEEPCYIPALELGA